MLRKIKLRLLLGSGLIYRLWIICVQTLFFWACTGQFTLALSTSVVWNCINMCCYYLYHYWFARLFNLGRKENP